MDFKQPKSLLLQLQNSESHREICLTPIKDEFSDTSNTTKSFLEKSLESEDNGSESEDENSKKAKDSGKTCSRKEKSLGKLCKRFLLAMCEEAKSGKDVHLETVSKKMSRFLLFN